MMNIGERTSKDTAVLDEEELSEQEEDVISLSSRSNDNSSSHNTHSASSTDGTHTSRTNGTDGFDEYVGDKSSATAMGAAKIFVLCFLLSLAVITAWLWWKFATEYEQENYSQVFYQYAEKVVQTFLNRVEYRVAAAASLAQALSSSASVNTNNNNWPMVSLSHFDRRVASTLRLTNATSVWFSPLVEPSDREAWEAYAAEHQYYLLNNFTTSTSSSSSVTDDDQEESFYRISNWDVANGMYRYDDNSQAVAQERGTGMDFYSPIWQSSSSSSSSATSTTTKKKQTGGIAMFNQPSEEMRRSVLNQIQRLGGQSTLFSESQLNGDNTPHSLVNSYGNEEGPHVFLYTPLLQQQQQQQQQEEDEKKKMVASLTLDIGWSTFWEGSVHGISGPLTIELIPSCGGDDGDGDGDGGYTFQVSSSDDGNATKFVQTGLSHYKNELGLVMASSFDGFWERMMMMNDGDALLGAASAGSSSASSSSSSLDDLCAYRIQVYPTQEFESKYLTKQPLLSGIALGAIFVVTAAVFICYDHFIQTRQKKVLQAATRSTAIIKSLFPAGIRNRLLDEGKEKNSKRLQSMLPSDYAMMDTPKSKLQSYLAPTAGGHISRKNSNNYGGIVGSEPIAEFFPAVTIMYADLSGFTAWSSTREPAQVFTLLETLYGAMDKAARRLGVFKVETVGDCYVAATGIPDPRADHAVLMAKFANTSLAQIKDLTGALESQLGPGTGDLGFRIGLHSGPVTAGVLRGEKSRFQLFGDTMSTTSKIESSGKAGRIHVSKETADLLIKGGKGDWLQETGESIVATGRGELVTYWLKTNFRKVNRTSLMPTKMRSGTNISSSNRGDHDEEDINKLAESAAALAATGGIGVRDSSSLQSTNKRNSKQLAMDWEMENEAKNKIDRLVDYNAEVMISLMKKIIARRSVEQDISREMELSTKKGSVALDEVKEVIEMPKYNEEASVKMASDYMVEIPDVVRAEMRLYIRRVADMYHPNPFHNFEHASHVALSANKLLKRIVMPEDVNYRRNSKEKIIEKVLAVAKDLHQATLGISSDPVAQFAVVFSALIHDVDHPGVPNGILAQEEPETAKKYRNQSIAEQRSIDIAWDILLEDDFKNLRKCMFPTPSELKHFRELIVNCVMATDIFDKDLGALRKARWQRCFHPEEFPFPDEDKTESFNRKATIVLEHIIQASDVAHTMQHWHVYIKWNERLFQEMYLAYKESRSDKDPSEGWYKGELWFFDNYVIPLAHKLKECGVFGVSSAEYLQYATENRDEWERKGLEVCKQMIANFESSHDFDDEEGGLEDPE